MVANKTRDVSGVIGQECGDNWQLYHGDSCQVLKDLPDDSIDFCIHSPPFSNLYIYSDSEADLGNCASDDEFIEHFSFIIGELFRVTVTGRLCAVHCKDLPKYANRDDTAGLKDFPGQIIRAFESHKWSYHSRITIWKCPVVERERTNNNGLLHKTVLRDRSQIRQGMADYLLVFRKPPIGTLMSDKPVVRHVNKLQPDLSVVKEPIGFTQYIGEHNPLMDDGHPSPFARTNLSGRNSIDIWRRYAEPVWWDVDQMDVLNYRLGRGQNDERHICPLQLGLIERAVELWTNEGDVVLTPFAGVGSELVGSLRQNRKAIGIELKAEYYQQAIANCQAAERIARDLRQPDFFPDQDAEYAESEE